MLKVRTSRVVCRFAVVAVGGQDVLEHKLNLLLEDVDLLLETRASDHAHLGAVEVHYCERLDADCAQEGVVTVCEEVFLDGELQPIVGRGVLVGDIGTSMGNG